MQDQDQVHRLLGIGRRHRSVQHVHEVAGMAEITARGHRFQAGGVPADRRNNRRHLGRQPDRLLEVGGRRFVFGERIVSGGHRHGGAERGHRRRVPRQRAQEVQHLGLDLAMVDELPVEVGELRAVGEFTLKQQVRRFFERRSRRQFVDVVAAVDELAEIPVDVADGGVGRDDSLQPPRRDLVGGMIFVGIWSDGSGHGLILALEDGTSGHDQLLALKKEGGSIVGGKAGHRFPGSGASEFGRRRRESNLLRCRGGSITVRGRRVQTRPSASVTCSGSLLKNVAWTPRPGGCQVETHGRGVRATGFSIGCLTCPTVKGARDIFFSFFGRRKKTTARRSRFC